MSLLLPFHKSIIDKIHDPLASELLLLARGLGLRRIVCKLLQIYDCVVDFGHIFSHVYGELEDRSVAPKTIGNVLMEAIRLLGATLA